MSDRTEVIRSIRKAAKQRELAEQARRAATVELREWCAKAQTAGIPITEIAREAGLSRQGVYDLISRPRRDQ